jgi:hypothetical protein
MMTPIRGPDGRWTLPAWELFVLRHHRPLNLAIHACSFAMFWGGPVAALATGEPAWLVAFFASGAVGAFGHWISGDGGVDLREATRSPTVVFFVTRLFARLLLGRYGEDLRRARDGLAAVQALNAADAAAEESPHSNQAAAR